MQRFISLQLENELITSNKLIEQYLASSDFHWLLLCEVDNVKLEIKDNILYWLDGIFYWGHWHWGVFKKGQFRGGTWLGGIFYDGIFRALWKNGKWIDGQYKGKGKQ